MGVGGRKDVEFGAAHAECKEHMRHCVRTSCGDLGSQQGAAVSTHLGAGALDSGAGPVPSSVSLLRAVLLRPRLLTALPENAGGIAHGGRACPRRHRACWVPQGGCRCCPCSHSQAGQPTLAHCPSAGLKLPSHGASGEACAGPWEGPGDGSRHQPAVKNQAAQGSLGGAGAGRRDERREGQGVKPKGGREEERSGGPGSEVRCWSGGGANEGHAGILKRTCGRPQPPWAPGRAAARLRGPGGGTRGQR